MRLKGRPSWTWPGSGVVPQRRHCIDPEHCLHPLLRAAVLAIDRLEVCRDARGKVEPAPSSIDIVSRLTGSSPAASC